MKIIFKSWDWFRGQRIRTVNVEETRNGYWRKRTQKALIAALKEKGIDVDTK